MNRVAVVGVTGVGKSMFAAQLAERLDADVIELDALHWLADWTPRDPEEFARLVDEATTAARWVSAGGYKQITVYTWGRADLLVWLNYSFPRVLWRLTKRTIRRIVTHEELWNGNRESVRKAFMSKDSLFVWLVQTYWSRPAEYERRLATEHPGLEFVRFTHPKHATRWLNDR